MTISFVSSAPLVFVIRGLLICRALLRQIAAERLWRQADIGSATATEFRSFNWRGTLWTKHKSDLRAGLLRAGLAHQAFDTKTITANVPGDIVFILIRC